MPGVRPVDPLFVKSAQPDAPHRGALDQTLARRANGLAFRLSGTTRTWAFPSPDLSPVASIEDLSTWYNFNSPSSFAWQVPWYQQKQHPIIRAYVTVAVVYDSHVKLRLHVSQMVQSMTAVDGPESTTLVADAGAPTEQPWAASVTRYRLATAMVMARVDSPASDRRCVLSLQASYSWLNNANAYPAGSTRPVYLHSIRVEDVHELVEES